MNVVPLMDEDAQRLYLNTLLSNPELYAQVQHILRPTFFDPHLAKGVKFIQDYFQENRTIPASSIYTAATKLPTDHVPLSRTDLEFVAGQLAEFCKFQACIDVIRRATGKDGYFEKGDLGTMVAQMKAATEIGLMTDLGIDYFDDPLARLEADEEEDPVISTGWKTVDDVIGGGVGLQELIMFLAPSGGGKSVSMLNLCYNLLTQGHSGVYISLEMRDKKVARRADQIIARLASNLINPNKTQVANEIERFHEQTGASFFVKRLREGSTSADILAYLRLLEARKSFRPNPGKVLFICADYLDIMGTTQRSFGDNLFLKDKFVAEEFRAIGFDYNSIQISASQLEKHATEKINNGEKMQQNNVQGGSSKTNTSDLMIAVCQTDAMAAASEVRFDFPKARNSDTGTKQVTLTWDKKTLRISDLNAGLTFKKKPSLQLQAVTPGSRKSSLNDLPTGV